MGTSFACAVAGAGAWRKTQCPGHGASCASGDAPSVRQRVPHRERRAGAARGSSCPSRDSAGLLQADAVPTRTLLAAKTTHPALRSGIMQAALLKLGAGAIAVRMFPIGKARGACGRHGRPDLATQAAVSRPRHRCCRQVSVDEVLAAAKLQHERSCMAGNVPPPPKCSVPGHVRHRAMNNGGAARSTSALAFIACVSGDGSATVACCASSAVYTWRQVARALAFYSMRFRFLLPIREIRYVLIDLRKEDNIAALLGDGSVGALPW